MATVTAKLTNIRQSPRKVRLVANLVRGKKVTVALNELSFLPKKAGVSIKNLIQSALANAKNLNVEPNDLYIKEIRVDKGVTLHRIMPRARGRAFPINKRSSHVLVVLDEKKTKSSK
jgi:large subunit ribosomal protein L22